LKKIAKRIDHEIIASWIPNGASILDLGCGDGILLSKLVAEQQIQAQGIELNELAIQQCVASGLSVFQQDIDSGLTEYSDESFDFVILNQTFQQIRKPDFVLQEALRVGRHVIVGFPNFCYITDRLQIFFTGKVPVTASLPYQWYDTPNLHFFSIADFKAYCKERNVKIEKSAFATKNKRVKFLPNVFGELGLFLLAGTKS
jgi:methionine biosynthesis protein MetW